MELSGKWWRSDVASQVHATLTERERARKRVFQGRSPQLTYRRQLVDWITSIAERHKLGLTSLHLAVYLLDFFMDNFDVSRNQLNLVAMGCLSVATKFEEKEEDIPKQNVLSHYCAGAYAASDFLQMELMLLKFFDWEVGLVTPAHFINFYIHFTCTEFEPREETSPETDSPQVDQTKKMCDSIKSYARYFMSVCIQYHHFHDYLPSVIAAASICATRFCLNLIPVYPPELQSLDTFSESQLLGCQRDLLLIHDRDKTRSPSEAESKKPKPETSTPEGTPEGGHVATKQQKNSKDDSVYHSDLSLDSDLDSLPMDIVTSVKEPPDGPVARVRSPSCSPIPLASSQELRLHDPNTRSRCNGVSIGSSEEGEEERMVEEVSSDDQGRFSSSDPSDGSVAETIEIDTNTEMSPETIFSTMTEVSVGANEAAHTSTRPAIVSDVDDFEDDDIISCPTARHSSNNYDDVTSGVDDVTQDFEDVVDLVDDSGDDEVFDEDSVDEVVVISEGRRVTNDSGLGIVAEDLGAEEECYDEASEDSEVFIEELRPVVNPTLASSHHPTLLRGKSDSDDLVSLEKPAAKKQQSILVPQEIPMASRSHSRIPSEGSSSDEIDDATSSAKSFLSIDGSFRVSIPFP